MIGSTFSFYLARHFLRNLAFVFLLFLGLIITVDLIELSRELSRVETVGFLDIFSIAVLRAPAFAENVLPFAVLFGSAASLLLLNRRLELVVARASGVSVWQFLLPLVATAICVGVFTVLIYNPASLSAQNQSRAAEALAFGKVKGRFANNNRNFWARISQPDGDAVIRARVSEERGAKLTGVTVYRFDGNGSSIERLDAQSARFIAGSDGVNRYELAGVTTTVPGQTGVDKDSVSLPVNITLSQLQSRSVKPEEVGFWWLGKHADEARQSGRNHLPFTTQYQSLVAQPFLFAAMVLLAATFSLRFARFGQSGRTVLGGIVAGFVVYVASRLVLTFGSNGLVPASLAAWSPVLIASLIAVTVLLHQEDG